MTPLAQAILNDHAQPIRARRFQGDATLPGALLSAHAFDVNAIQGIARDMAQAFVAHGSDERLAFLPAPATWLEWVAPTALNDPRTIARHGALIEAEDGAQVARMRSCVGYPNGELIAYGERPLRLSVPASPHVHHADRRRFIMSLDCSDEFFVAALACINTPRVIGRRQHMPHAGLQRKLAKARGMVGRYPLQAWHELVLEVAPPRVDVSEPQEAHLTGARALHFCRSHLRIRLGRLELVSAHWRGDPALGIKQTRYRMVQGRAA